MSNMDHALRRYTPPQKCSTPFKTPIRDMTAAFGSAIVMPLEDVLCNRVCFANVTLLSLQCPPAPDPGRA
jgi:hypothetical protein